MRVISVRPSPEPNRYRNTTRPVAAYGNNQPTGIQQGRPVINCWRVGPSSCFGCPRPSTSPQVRSYSNMQQTTGTSMSAEQDPNGNQYKLTLYPAIVLDSPYANNMNIYGKIKASKVTGSSGQITPLLKTGIRKEMKLVFWTKCYRRKTDTAHFTWPQNTP